MSNRRSHSETNVFLILKRWVRKTSVAAANPGYWTESLLARLLVGITVFLWLAVLLVHLLVDYEPEVPPLPFLPLYAFYPGEIISGQINSHPALLHAWGLAAAVVFLTLAFLAVGYKKKAAGLAFFALFLISTLIVYARIVDELRALHFS